MFFTPHLFATLTSFSMTSNYKILSPSAIVTVQRVQVDTVSRCSTGAKFVSRPGATLTDTHFRQALVIAAIEHELGNLNGSAVGVGPVRAAAGAAHLFCVHRPPLAVLIGTAGAYLESIVPPAVIAARRVGFADQAVAHNTGYVPLPPETIVLDTTMTDRLGVPSHDVLTVSAITTDPGITATYAKRWQIEHMEAWAVAWAAQQAGVPLVILLGVANQVGPHAHAEWLANREAAEAAAREVALRLLAQVE